MSIAFDKIPASGLVAPGVFVEIKAGGEGFPSSRTLLLGHKTSAGTMADNTVAAMGSVEDALALAGKGSQLYEMARLARTIMPAGEIWLGAVPATGTAEVKTITINSTPASGGQAVIEIAGREVPVFINAGDSASTAAAALNAAINAFVDAQTGAYLPLTSTVSGAVVTCTLRHAGAVMAGIEIVAPVDKLPSNALAGRITVATPTAGSGTADLSTILAALGDEPFDTILSAFNDTTNIGRLDAFLADIASGRWSYDRQIYGTAWHAKSDTIANLVTYGGTLNTARLVCVPRPLSTPTPDYEWLTAMASTVIPWLHDATGGNCMRNHSALTVAGIRPPRDMTQAPNYGSRNTLLQNGVSSYLVAFGQVLTDKFVTMRRLGAQGQPEDTFRNVQAVYGVMHAVRHVVAEVKRRLSNRSLADANPYSVGAIATPADARGVFVNAYRDTSRFGLTQDEEGFARTLKVEINPSTGDRLDVEGNFRLVGPLDVIALKAVVWKRAIP